MGKTILIVEDEFLVALNLSRTLSTLGFEPIGIAPDAETAMRLASEKPDFALVDVNLRDGETGPTIGKMLAQNYGVAVLFLTANPASLGEGVAGTIGCLSKPVDEIAVETALEFMLDHVNGATSTPPPSIRVFGNDNDQAFSNRSGIKQN
ncbi:response regulator [Sphingorhabdus sp.]|uniref:response regulator n=1 Tax=Sphingorhabdus sp. TaxID=1902408 RepID=UPI00391D0273